MDRLQLNTVKETSGELHHDWESDKVETMMAQMQEVGRFEKVSVDFTIASAHKIIITPGRFPRRAYHDGLLLGNRSADRVDGRPGSSPPQNPVHLPMMESGVKGGRGDD